MAESVDGNLHSNKLRLKGIGVKLSFGGFINLHSNKLRLKVAMAMALADLHSNKLRLKAYSRRSV